MLTPHKTANLPIRSGRRLCNRYIQLKKCLLISKMNRAKFELIRYNRLVLT